MNISRLYMALFLVVTQVFSAQNISLAINGRPDFQIVVPKGRTDVEWQAAFLLKKYLDKVIGSSVPVVLDTEPQKGKEILVGKTNRSSLDTSTLTGDGITIQSSSSKIKIGGGNRKGVLYAASTFLEDYAGVRKYTKDFEKIPNNPNLAVPNNISVTKNPVFNFRNTYFEDAVDRDYADWHKLNYFFESRVNFAHSFNQYLPDVLFKTHPEYFALVDGKRTPVQPCLSNPEVYKIMKANLMKEMAAHPENKVWSISATDDGTYCHCNLCEPKHKAGNGFIETLMPFVNRFAKDFPDKTISTLAYRQSIDPSKFVKPLPNVEIMLCFTHVNRALPIATGPDNAKMFRDITARWKQQTSNIFVWDYVINYFNTLSPFPNLQVLQPNIQYFRDNNFKGVFEQGSGDQKSEFNELKCYLISKLLWNPDADVAALQNEFIDAFYGDGAPEIKEYVALLQSNVKKTNAIVDIWADPKLNKDNFLSKTNIESYRAILNRALQKTQRNPTVYNRILKEKLSVDYAEIQTAEGVNFNSSKEQDKINNFTMQARKMGIKFLMNGELTPEQYRDKILKK